MKKWHNLLQLFYVLLITVMILSYKNCYKLYPLAHKIETLSLEHINEWRKTEIYLLFFLQGASISHVWIAHWNLFHVQFIIVIIIIKLGYDKLSAQKLLSGIN